MHRQHPMSGEGALQMRAQLCGADRRRIEADETWQRIAQHNRDFLDTKRSEQANM